MSRLDYTIRRLLLMIPMIFGVSVLVFLLIHLVPGDPAAVILGVRATPRDIQLLRNELGLDRPFLAQYGSWIWGILHGDMGVDFRSHVPLTQLIRERLPVTLELTLLAMGISIAISIPLGVQAAIRRRSHANRSANVLGLLGISIPDFWLGIMFILLFTLVLRWLPSSGYIPFGESPLQNLRHMVLPAVTLALAQAAVVTRMTRASMLDVLSQDYIQFTRSKGLRRRKVHYRHALKNAAIPVITVIGLQFGYLLGGAIIIEQIFALPGLGKLVLDSVFNRNYFIVQGMALVIALFFMLINLATDLLYTWLNPKVEYGD